MSRSFKKHPYGGDNKSKFGKKQSNRTLRRKLKNPDFVVDNMSYKKIYERWDICDYWWYQPFEEYYQRVINMYNYYVMKYGEEQTYMKFPNKDEEYKRWFKYYKRK